MADLPNDEQGMRELLAAARFGLADPLVDEFVQQVLFEHSGQEDAQGGESGLAGLDLT